MARYYLDNFHRLETCCIDRDNKTIYISRPTTVIALHRELADLFDDIDWIIDVAPTLRYDDLHCEARPPWLFENTEMLHGELVMWNEPPE